MVYEGDRRFELQVRLPERQRADMAALKHLPIRLPALGAGGNTNGVLPGIGGNANGVLPTAPAYVALGEVANLEVVEGPIRLAVRTANEEPW
jgi:cobalt-zinc-cadmium resistance protein CzcA